MKAVALCFFLSILACQGADATKDRIYVLNEKSLTFGTTLSIEGCGEVSEQTISLTRSFSITGKLSGSSSEEFFSTSTTYNIKDGEGHVLAKVKKDAVMSFFTFMGNIYTIYDTDDHEIAKSELSKGIRPTFTITEKTGAISKLTASGWFYYTWEIRQGADSHLDPRVLWIIAASKTAADNDK